MPTDEPSDYAKVVKALEQKRDEWNTAKSGAKTDQQKADVDKRYGENIKLMEKERDDIKAAKPGQAKLHDSRGGKDATAKDKGREPG